MLSGLVLVDKPGGITSHNVVSQMRRIAGTRKVGHAGTLDPMATGLLVVGIGKATRLLTYVVGTGKRYTGTIRLGQGTLTDDVEGEFIAQPGISALSPAVLEAAREALTGNLLQVPSSVSAIKVNGQRAYAKVREGEEVHLKAREVNVARFTILERRDLNIDGVDLVDLDVDIECSSGTYIRALARDLGAALGSAGHLTALRRTEVGPFSLEHAHTLEELSEDLQVISLERAARELFEVRSLDWDQVRDLSHGRFIDAQPPEDAQPTESEPAVLAAVDPEGKLIALVRNAISERGENYTRPLLVFEPEAGVSGEDH